MGEFKPLRALGLMSGTSLDGVDAAILTTDGAEIFEFGPTAFRPYTTDEQVVLAKSFGRWPEDATLDVAALDSLIDSAHADAVSMLPTADLLGFHGQTLSHDPDHGRTYQAGNSQALAQMVQAPTVWDFRSNDMRFGGQGAPLAPFFHFACAKWANMTEPVAFLNLGGVGNVTLVDPSKATPEEDGAVFAFDTGPANAPLNDLVQARLGQSYDRDGHLAAQGTADMSIIGNITSRNYFAAIPPKSLDRHDFHDVLELVSGLSTEDAAATLTALIAACVMANQKHLPFQPKHWFVSGGGARNPEIMRRLGEYLPGVVAPIEDIGLNGDMLEAQAFAYLAVRSLRGLPLSAPMTTGCAVPTTGGRLSNPFP